VIRRPLFLAAFALAAPPALANDSTAELAAGGITFLKDPDIAMRSEDLFISAKQVRVVYEFANQASADKTALVAFPMPDIEGAVDFTVGVPDGPDDNPFAFAILADGKPVATALDEHASFKGSDRTAQLRKLGVPLRPYLQATQDALDKLDPETQKQMVDEGMVYADETSSSANGPLERHLIALWTYRSAFTWTQTFPAGKSLHLEQAYKPGVGSSAGTMVGSPGWRTNPDRPGYGAKYCIDKDFENSVVAAARKKKADYPPFNEQRIDYVLTTGANWAGPIGDFHLTVDKGEPNYLLSLCADGIAKTGPTRFELSKKNFTPTRDLNILILTPYP